MARRWAQVVAGGWSGAAVVQHPTQQAGAGVAAVPLRVPHSSSSISHGDNFAHSFFRASTSHSRVHLRGWASQSPCAPPELQRKAPVWGKSGGGTLCAGDGRLCMTLPVRAFGVLGGGQQRRRDGAQAARLLFTEGACSPRGHLAPCLQRGGAQDEQPQARRR